MMTDITDQTLSEVPRQLQVIVDTDLLRLRVGLAG